MGWVIGCFFDAAVIGVGVQNFYIKFYPEWDDWNDKETGKYEFHDKEWQTKEGSVYYGVQEYNSLQNYVEHINRHLVDLGCEKIKPN